MHQPLDALIGVQMSQSGEFNRARVFELIHLFEPVSRAEIAARLDLTSATVSNIVSELISRGYVTQLGRRGNHRGQPAIELGIKADAAYTVGLHFEHGSVAGIVADLKGTVISRQRVALAPLPSPRIVLDALIHMGLELIQQVEFSKIIGIGLATVGPIDQAAGSVTRTDYTSDWDDVAMRGPLREAFELPVFMDNNATAGAIGEYWYGRGRSYQNFLYVGFYSIGLGGGLVLNKRVYRGTGLNAAEFGHMLVSAGTDGMNSPDYLENYVSGHALRNEFGDDILDTLDDRINNNEPAMMQWLDSASHVFANALVSVDHLLDLETIIVGGQLPPRFFKALLERVEDVLDPLYMHGWTRRSTLQMGNTGLDSAVMGAATLPIYDAFSPDSERGKSQPYLNSVRVSAAGGPM